MAGNGQYPPPPHGPGQPQRPPSLPWPPPQRQGAGQYPPQGPPYPQGPPAQNPYPQGPYPPQNPYPQGPYPQQAPPPPPPQGQPYGGPYQQGPQYPPQGPGWTPPPPPPPMPPRPGPYGHWQQPPRKKSGGAVAVIGALLGTMAALFVLLVIGSAVLKKSHTEEPANPIALPTYTPSDLPSPGETSDPVKPTRRPTPTNDDQPDVDQPPQQVVLNKGLKENTMYKSGALPNTACPAGNVNVFNGAQLKALIIKTGHCMDKGWKQILEKQGIDWSPPGYAIAAKRGRGACGDYPSAGSMVPYYCPRNNTIYASTSALAKGSGNQMGYGQIISWSGGIISMMAHEYGHHVQNLTGILDAHWQKHLASSSESGRLALSRKLELQATCFGGMWMRSVAGSYPVSTSNRQSLFSFYGQVGDWPGYPRDHGSRTNNYRWFRQGYDRNKSYQCNTWLAPASTTS